MAPMDDRPGLERRPHDALAAQPRRPGPARRPHLALAAKLLLGLAVAIAFLLLGGEASSASEHAPPGGLLDRPSPVAPARGPAPAPRPQAPVAPVRTALQATVDVVSEVVAPVVEVTPAPAPSTPAAPEPRAERTVRVLPRTGGGELLRIERGAEVDALEVRLGEVLDIDLAVDEDGLALGVALELPPVAVDVDVTLPPAPVVEVDLPVLGEQLTRSAATATPNGAATATPVVEAPRATVRPDSHHAAPASRAPGRPGRPTSQPATDGVPAASASASASAHAVLDAPGARLRGAGAEIVRVASTRIPVAPATRPSFSPD